MKTKSLPKNLLALAALIFALFGNVKQADAYDFSATLNSGQTVYYQVTNAANHEVGLTYPNSSSDYWGNFTKPTGNMVLSETVYHNGTAYTLTSIGSSAFAYCSGITAVTIPSTMTTVASNAFFECPSLHEVTINSQEFLETGVTLYVDIEYIFGNQVTSYILGPTVTNIPMFAFSGCNNMTTVSFLGNVNYIDSRAFEGCTSLTTVNVSSITSWLMITFFDEMANPLYYAHNLYVDGSVVHGVTVPSSITTIKPYAFDGCTSLYHVYIESALTTIGNSAFAGCTNLTMIEPLDNLTSIGWYAFSSCSSLHSITLSNSLTSIGTGTFYNSGLTSITIPNSVQTIGSDAFQGCSLLTRVNISDLNHWNEIYFDNYSANPLSYAHHLYLNNRLVTDLNGVTATYIGHYVFCGCTDFSSLTIPSSVTSIGTGAFTNCTGITSLTIPSSVTTIRGDAFFNCSSMATVSFIGHPTSIESAAFSGCTSLTRVNTNNLDSWCEIEFGSAPANPLYYAHHLYLNNNLVTNLNSISNATSIGNYAFNGCTGLTSVTIPNTVQSIGSYAFGDCTDFISVTIPSSVQSIRNNAFNNCTNLTTVTINSNAVASASYSYYNGGNNFRTRFGNQVTSYTLGPEVTAIGQYAFYGCSGMTEVTFLGPVSSMGSYAFENCTGLTRVNVSNLDAWCEISFNASYSNPLYHAHHLYHNNNLVTQLDDLSTATSIGRYAFYGLTDLTSVTVPSSVQSIGNNAFDVCPNLTTVTINSNAVASATNYSHSGTGNNFRTRFGNQVTSYTLGPEVTAIGKYAFSGCTGMTEVTFLGPVSSMGSYAFENCTGLTRVNVSDLDAWCEISFESTNSNPIYYTHQLYYNNNLVTQLDDLSTATSIGRYAFYGLTDLTSVTVPSSVQSIGNNAFDVCPNLTTVTINSNAVASANYSYSYGYNNFRTRFGNQVTSYTLGPEVTAIGKYAFCNCTGMTEVTIPSSVQTIGADAFHGCTGFTSLTIPSSVQTIGANTFYGCSGITELYVGAMTPPTISNNTFTDVSRSIPVYVPIGTGALYRAHQYWSMFTNIIESSSANSSIVAVPYEQTFDDDVVPEDWATYSGYLHGSGNTYTATLTPATGGSTWLFGEKNGVFDSHGYALIGANSAEYKWMVSPRIMLDDGSNYYVQFDLGMSRQVGTQVPLTPEAQDHQYVAVLVSSDGCATWHTVGAWRHEMGYMDLDALNPQGYTYHFDLSSYQGQTVQLAFYAECTDGSDAENHVHIDDFLINTFVPGGAPDGMWVNEITGHSAKVHWNPPFGIHYGWDIRVELYSGASEPSLNVYNGTTYHIDGAATQYIITDLTPNESYSVWVRHHLNDEVGDWSERLDFDTEDLCPIPRDITVIEHGLHSATITWTPGDENQTSWFIYVDNYHDMDGDYLDEPSFTMNNLVPGENYDFYLIGYCGDDGESDQVDVDFTMSDYPSLTLNDGSYTNEEVPITGSNCGSKTSRTQFIIPAEQLTGLQYSHIKSLTFDNQQYTSGQPWGEDASFDVYLKVVDQDDFSDGEFYDWDELYCIGSHNPSISGHLMTITIDDYHQFYYSGGNLLVGFYQEEYDFTPGQNFSHADWIGVDYYTTNPDYKPSIFYNGSTAFPLTFTPKVTFTYEPDPYLPPTNLVVYVTAPDQVTLTWTPREGQTATDVQLLDEDMEPIGTPWTWGGGNIFGLANLDPGTTYNVCIRGLYRVDGVNYYSAWTAPVEFTTLDLCAAPENLQVNDVGPFTATLTWDSNAAYEEVEYRALEIQWEESFEGGSLPSGWTSIANGYNYGKWNVITTSNNTSPHTGTYQLRSGASNSNGQTDNWLVLPQMELGGVLKFWSKTSMGGLQSFSVYVSTQGSNVADFATEPILTGSSMDYQEFTVNLSGYSGSGYVALRHQYSGSNGALVVDDVSYFNGSTWTSIGYVEGGQYDFEGLTPGTTYQARVRSMCEVGDASYLGYWTDPVIFSTPGNIVFEDDDVKDICVDYWDIDRDGELSYAEAEAVTSLMPPGSGDHGPFYDNPNVDRFNELQYFTGLTEIGDHAFKGCANLNAITLPPTITSIGNYAFGYSVDNLGYPVPCSSLQSIVIPPSVTTIGYYAFSRSGLTEVILPPSVTSIGVLAFGDCDNLEYVYLPASVTSIEGNAFTGTSIETIEVDQENPVYDSRGGCNAIIQTDINKLITGCKNTVIPDDVVSIGVSAFENATGLTTITLPSSVESIGEYAFANCDGLNTINAERLLPPTIYGNTFLNMVHSNVTVNVPCGALTDYRNAEIWSGLSFNYVDPCNIVFADANVKAICVTNWDTNGDGELSYTEATAVTNIGTVFRDNTSITSFNELQYFTGLTSLVANAFNGCSQLASIMLPNNIIIIGNYAFSGCSSLFSVTLSDQLVRIMNNAFVNCSALSHIDIPSTVTYIGSSFGGCSSLSSIVIPASVNTIVDGAFNNCYSLQSIVVEPENTVYDSRNACNAIIKTATNELVIGCDNTEIPDDVVTIGANAFYGRSQMTTIVLPASVTSIGSTAFMGCGGVMEMHVNATTPPSLGNGVFGGSPAAVNPSIPVYVPCESIEAYQNATGWSSFTNYQESDVFICFADPAVKALCVDPATGWDINGDGQLSYAEAAAVRTLNPSGASNSSVFKGNTTITSFDELQYFTGLSVIKLYAFQNCTALTSVTLPPTVTKIDYEAFMNCGLTGTLTLPEAVTTIEQDAFMNCSGLTGLVIGSGVTSIGSLAFYNCTGLESITIEAVNPPALGEYDPFDNVPKDIPVNVPCGALSAYQAAANWSAFTNFVDPCASQPQVVTLAAGTNWFSSNVEITLADLQNALTDVLGTNASITISSQTQSCTLKRNRWTGTLETIDLSQMYMIEIENACEFSLEGEPINPANHPVTISFGENWVAFPLNVAMSLDEAFAGFAQNDDAVSSQTQNASRKRNKWTGTLTELQPGQGFIYTSSVNGDRTLVFPTSK